MSKTKVIPLEEKTTRLKLALEQFSMTVVEERANGEFFRWNIRRMATSFTEIFSRAFEEDVASVTPDLLSFAVNPDGPVSFDDCKEIVSAIETEFGVKTEQLRQMRYQGGL